MAEETREREREIDTDRGGSETRTVYMAVEGIADTATMAAPPRAPASDHPSDSDMDEEADSDADSDWDTGPGSPGR